MALSPKVYMSWNGPIIHKSDCESDGNQGWVSEEDDKVEVGEIELRSDIPLAEKRRRCESHVYSLY
jgi:hypothetical protein